MKNSKQLTEEIHNRVVELNRLRLELLIANCPDAMLNPNIKRMF